MPSILPVGRQLSCLACVAVAGTLAALLLARSGNAAGGSLGAALEVDQNGDAAAILSGTYTFWHKHHGGSSKYVFEGNSEWLLDEARFADADFTAEVALEHGSVSTAVHTFDAAYRLQRDFDAEYSPVFAAIDTDHVIEAFAGVRKQLGSAALALDAGSLVKLHEDLDRIGFSKFDRGTQDFAAPEAALRLGLGNPRWWRPFFEVAYVARIYLDDSDLAGRNRNMHGPEFIAGFEIERDRFSAQAGIIYLHRSFAEPQVADAEAIGPYIDLSYKPDPKTEVIFAAATRLDQETTGSPRAHPVYASRIEFKREMEDGLSLIATGDAEFEDRWGKGGDLTLSGAIELRWSHTRSLTWIAAAEASCELVQSAEEAQLAGAMKAGVEVSF